MQYQHSGGASTSASTWTSLQLLAQQYSEASHAFLVRDFARTSQLLDALKLDIASQSSQRERQSQQSGSSESSELARKVWILAVTLLASNSSSVPAEPGSLNAERALAELHTQICSFYNSSTLQSPSAHLDHHLSPPLHPSILVALSLAGLKLGLPPFVRRLLEDYFDVLLCTPSPEEDLEHSHLVTANGDSSILDASSADLSLSGIHGEQSQGSSTSARPLGWAKSLHRLARIYTVHVLGRAFGEWAEARAWIQRQAEEESGIQIVTDESTRTALMTELARAEATHNAEQIAATRASTRQTELQKQQDAENQQIRKDEEQQLRRREARERSEHRRSNRRHSPTSAVSNTTEGSSRETTKDKGKGRERNNGEENGASSPDTIANLRERITSLLPRSGPSVPLPRSASFLDVLRNFLARLAHSRVLLSVVLLFLLVGAWRRRLSSSRGRGRPKLSEWWATARQKILETIRMGGNLGFV